MITSQMQHNDARERLVADLESLLEDLLQTIGASRVTLRLDNAKWSFGINDVVAEARAPGEKSLRGQTSINQRAAATAQWIEQHRRLLVQGDLATGEPRAPDALIALYNVKAQMLAPIVREGHLDGWVSVHEARSTRQWKEHDQAAAVAAAARVLAMLERVDSASASKKE
jgi:maleate isomerase